MASDDAIVFRAVQERASGLEMVYIDKGDQDH